MARGKIAPRGEVEFGALSPPLHEQLGVAEEVVRADQRQADAVVRLAIGGLLTDSESHRIRLRLAKRLARFGRASGAKGGGR